MMCPYQRLNYFNNLSLNLDKGSGRINDIRSDLPEFSEDDLDHIKDLSVDSVSVGGREEELMAKFPLSTKHRCYNSRRMTLAEMKDDYYYEIKISGDRGTVSFHIKKRRITGIEIEFNYPDD